MPLTIGKSKDNLAHYNAIQREKAHYEGIGRRVAESLSRAEQSRPAASSVSEFVANAGGTRKAAEALGVSQRTVERYLKGEKGQGGQTRNIQRSKVYERFKELAKGGKEKLREKGAEVKYRGKGGKSETVWDVNHPQASLNGETLGELIDLADKGDMEELGHRFEESYGDAYVPDMAILSIDSLDFQPK